MRRIILFVVFVACSRNIYAQNLGCVRAQYATKNNFGIYCTNEIKKKCECPPPPPLQGKTIRLFKIPYNIRRDLYPFNVMDSILIKKENEIITYKSEHDFKTVSNIFFNYYTLRYWALPVSITYSCDGEVKPEIDYEVLIYIKNGIKKYIRYYSNGEEKTNFDEVTTNSLDITLEKIKMIVE